MSWENLSDPIRNKIEKFKLANGSISATKLDELTEIHFNDLKNSEFFADEFDGVDQKTLSNWLARIKVRLKSVIVTTIDPDTVVSGDDKYDRWITDERIPGDQWHYWSRYATFLKKIGRPVDVIKSTEKSTREIVERLGDPKKDIEELQKGLVLGSVQSGKTANFNGVLNRAIDVKYDIIIVFSGIMEDLRVQTQKRINKEVIGLGEVGDHINQPVGVGIIEPFGKGGIYQITSITSTITDFKKSLIDANFDFNNQRILVCKKNVGVLANLIYWLKTSMKSGEDKLNMSILVIDDEADNASLNNLGHKGAQYASKVNGHIRALLNLFKRKSYLGYTATPFANILQDQNEGIEEHDAWKIPFRYNGEVKELTCSLTPSLFPDKFIYKLSAPTSYLGPQKFFSNGREQEGDKKIPLIVTIPKADEDPIVKVDESHKLPKSLVDAIDCFILSIALRDARINVLETLPGYTRHHSMLIHISRYINDQNNVAATVRKYIKNVRDAINEDRLNDPNGIYEKLKLQWNRFFTYQVENITSFLPASYNTDGLMGKKWDEISELLPTSVANIEVRAINSDSGQKLDYPETGVVKYIAVGGNRLSRGFTLEGLTINYFLRDTNYYDSLLQMGRWFGYRPGYIDACRLFIDFDTEEKYNYITAALTDLEEMIESMEVKRLTPKEFELRIKKHPDVLQITRKSILNNAQEVKLSFQDEVQQTTVFEIEKGRLENSWLEFKRLFNEIKPYAVGIESKKFYQFIVNTDTLYRFFELTNCFTKGEVMWAQIRKYIELCNGHGKLVRWRIAIKRTGNGRPFRQDGFDLALTHRGGPSLEESEYYSQLKNDLIFEASGKSRNIMTSGMDQAVGLSAASIDEAIVNFRSYKREKLLKAGKSEVEASEEANNSTLPGWIFRKNRSEAEGLLLVYLIDLEKVFHNDDLEQVANAKEIDLKIPLIGYALSFPEIKDDPGAIYLANKVEELEDSVIEGDIEIPDDFNNDINEIN